MKMKECKKSKERRGKEQGKGCRSRKGRIRWKEKEEIEERRIR